MQLIKLIPLLAVVAVGASAVQTGPQKQILISFPSDTPQSEVNDYKSVIDSAGGEILHEWETIKGFIVKVSVEALDTIKAFGEKEGGGKATIEEDESMSTQS